MRPAWKWRRPSVDLDRTQIRFRPYGTLQTSGATARTTRWETDLLVLLSYLSAKRKSNIRTNNGTTKAEATKGPDPMSGAADYVAACRSLLCD
jgi:hypothetical protein